MARLDNVVFVAIAGRCLVIKMYTADTLSPLGEDINIAENTVAVDLVACPRERQLYVGAWHSNSTWSLWRMSADDHTCVKWLPSESKPEQFRIYSLSLKAGRLLVTSSSQLRQYGSADSQLLRIIELPEFMRPLLHSVEQARSGLPTFVVSHKGTSQDREQYAVSELFSIVIIDCSKALYFAAVLSYSVARHVSKLLFCG